MCNVVYLCCKGVRTMTYITQLGLKNNILTMVMAGLTAAFTTEGLSESDRLDIMEHTYEQYRHELVELDKQIDAEDEVGDPFVGLEVK